MSILGVFRFYGQSGNPYDFAVYPPSTDFGHFGGVYAFLAHDFGSNSVKALYVGIASDFTERFADHDKWQPAIDAGANSVGILVNENEFARRAIETDLIKGLNPGLNIQHNALAYSKPDVNGLVNAPRRYGNSS